MTVYFKDTADVLWQDTADVKWKINRYVTAETFTLAGSLSVTSIKKHTISADFADLALSLSASYDSGRIITAFPFLNISSMSASYDSGRIITADFADLALSLSVPSLRFRWVSSLNLKNSIRLGSELDLVNSLNSVPSSSLIFKNNIRQNLMHNVIFKNEIRGVVDVKSSLSFMNMIFDADDGVQVSDYTFDKSLGL